MISYLKTSFSIFKQPEILLQEIDSSGSISFKNIIWGSLLTSLIFSLSLILMFGIWGFLMVLPIVPILLVCSFFGVFINAAITLGVLKLAKGQLDYHKIVNLYAYFLILGGLAGLLSYIPIIGPLCTLIASFYLLFMELKLISQLTEVSILKLIIMHIVFGVILALIATFGFAFAGFALFL